MEGDAWQSFKGIFVFCWSANNRHGCVQRCFVQLVNEPNFYMYSTYFFLLFLYIIFFIKNKKCKKKIARRYEIVHVLSELRVYSGLQSRLKDINCQCKF